MSGPVLRRAEDSNQKNAKAIKFNNGESKTKCI
jgi:hypothetical protein